MSYISCQVQPENFSTIGVFNLDYVITHRANSEVAKFYRSYFLRVSLELLPLTIYDLSSGSESHWLEVKTYQGCGFLCVQIPNGTGRRSLQVEATSGDSFAVPVTEVRVKATEAVHLYPGSAHAILLVYSDQECVKVHMTYLCGS